MQVGEMEEYISRHGLNSMRLRQLESTVEIAVQINGKTKATLAIGKEDPKDGLSQRLRK